jgi:hypothetical protein
MDSIDCSNPSDRALNESSAGGIVDMRPSPQWSVIASNRSNRPASCSGASYVCWQADDRCSSPYGIPTRAFAPLLSRLGGVMLSVRIANPVNEKRVIATLRAKGAADIEQAHGEWRDGDWGISIRLQPRFTTHLVKARRRFKVSRRLLRHQHLRRLTSTQRPSIKHSAAKAA